MKLDRLDNYSRGWVIGNFAPALVQTSDFEIAIHNVMAGDTVEPHYQKTATEYTVVVSGKIRFEDNILSSGDIFVYEPLEVCDVEIIEDAVTVVIKTPSVGIDDKVIVNA